MHRKAQAEFALILGLLIIAAVVAIYVYPAFVTPSVSPGALTEDQKAAEAYAKDAIRRSAGEALVKIYDSGGYAGSAEGRSIGYGGSGISYWQVCGSVTVPDVERNLERGIESELKAALPDSTDIAGRRVVFDKSRISADASLFDNSIGLSVSVPTTVEGRALPQPFELDVRSGLGRIYEFSSDFARFQSVYRPLDYNLLRLIRRSNPYSCWLPTEGVAFQGSFSKSWVQLRDCMEQLIIHNLATTYEWEKPVLVNGKLPNSMLDKSWLFEVRKEDGSWGQYKELEVDFLYGGGDRRLSRADPELTFGTTPDPVKFKGGGFPLLFGSLGPMLTYDVAYDVSYPVVVSVWDPLAERHFKFATFVSIRKNLISAECAPPGAGGAYQQECIESATEPMSLTVKDVSGRPLSGIDVWYGGCGPWRVFDGSLQTKIPQAAGATLSMLDEFSGSELSFCADSGELANKAVTFPVKRAFDVSFYAVTIRKDRDGGMEIISIAPAGTKNVTAIFTRPGNPCMNATESVASSLDARGGVHDTGWADLYPGVGLDVTVYGNSNVSATGFEVAGDETLRVYAPFIEGGAAPGDDLKVGLLYSRCVMSPVSAQDFSSTVRCSLS